MERAPRTAVVAFVDRRFAAVADGSPKAGTIEVIYELDEDPETLRALVLPEAEVPEGLRKRDRIELDESSEGPRIRRIQNDR